MARSQGERVERRGGFFFFFEKRSVLKERWRMKEESATREGDAGTVSDSGFFCKSRKSIAEGGGGGSGRGRGDELREEEQEEEAASV